MTQEFSISERHAVLARVGAADKHAALVVHPDRLAATERHISHVDLMAASRKISDDRLGVGALDLQLAAEREAARRLGRLLRVEAAIEHPMQEGGVPHGLM